MIPHLSEKLSSILSLTKERLLLVSALTFCILTLHGCASGLVQSQSNTESSSELGTLVIIARPSNSIQKHFASAQVLVDGKRIGNIGFEEKARLHLKSGYREIKIFGNSINAYLPFVKPDLEKKIEIEKQKAVIYQYSFVPDAGCSYTSVTAIGCSVPSYSWITKLTESSEPDLKLAFEYSE